MVGGYLQSTLKEMVCRACDKEAFKEGMYQWAATLTSSGQVRPTKITYFYPCERQSTDWLAVFGGSLQRNALHFALKACSRSYRVSCPQNMPFVLPIQADKTPAGFDIAFLRVIQGMPSRTARICCAVEDIPEVTFPPKHVDKHHQACVKQFMLAPLVLCQDLVAGDVSVSASVYCYVSHVHSYACYHHAPCKVQTECQRAWLGDWAAGQRTYSSCLCLCI